MLRARGREETLILGSDTLKPIIRELLPEAEIVSRPRFSTLRYAGSVKLSRLPPRSAVVAFSAEQVYALAEMLRRFKGGAAVVMGALSPATRNAQVAMFQRGEVDYLVATDAIGMGLNMDVTHVAFAGLEKFDGRRDRRLTHRRNGADRRARRAATSATAASARSASAAMAAPPSATRKSRRSRSIASGRSTSSTGAIADLDFTDVTTLIASLEAPQRRSVASARARGDRPRRAEAGRRGSGDRRQARRQARAGCGRRAACPISARSGRCTTRAWSAACSPTSARAGTSRTNGSPPKSRGSTTSTATSRRWPTASPGIRSWAYIAHRADWLAEPAKWAERTREVEARLSDALHERLTQRFVDRRTAVLVRDIGARGADALPVTVAADGEVSVGPEPIGHLTGFDFRVDPSARLADKRLLLAAAERRLGDELDRRAKSLVEAPATKRSNC